MAEKRNSLKSKPRINEREKSGAVGMYLWIIREKRKKRHEARGDLTECLLMSLNFAPLRCSMQRSQTH